MKLYDTSSWTVSQFDANKFTTNQVNNRVSSRSGSFGVSSSSAAKISGSGLFGSNVGAKGYSIVGLQVGEIPNMRSAINTYVDGIETFLSNISPDIEANAAFRSDDVQTAVKKYLETVKTYCINLTSQLRAFSDKLADVKATYEANMATLSGAIDSNRTAFDAGTKYKETLQ